MWTLAGTLLLGLFSPHSVDGSTATCTATLHTAMSIGSNAYKTLPGSTTAACCSACTKDPSCAAFVTGSGGGGECLLKKDLSGMHAKPTNDCGVVRGTPGPPAPPAPPGPTPPPPAPLPPPGSPRWELVTASVLPVIGPKHPDVISHTIMNGFETGQYQRINATFFYTANELGMCPGMVWDLVTRAALWSAPNSTGPWTRVTTLRNGSHIKTLCTEKPKPPCSRGQCGVACCPGPDDATSFVTWAPTLIHAPSSVNESGKDVWNLFYSSNQNAVSKNDEVCIANEKLCIQNEELCIKNEEFCIIFKMMNFAALQRHGVQRYYLGGQHDRLYAWALRRHGW